MPLLEKMKTFMATNSPRKKYLAEIVLRVPVMFVIHFLLVLSPSSNYTPVECVLYIMKYSVVVSVFDTSLLPRHTLVTLYCSMTMNIFVSWMMEKMYWTFQNEAIEACHDIWLPWGEDSWWTPALVTLILQAGQLWYLSKLCTVKSSLRLQLCSVILLPYTLCMFNVGLSYLVSIIYVLYKGVFCLLFINGFYLGFLSINNSRDNYNKYLTRDICTIFCVTYYFCCVVFDLVFVHNVSHILSFTYLTSSIGQWCTSFCIVMSLGCLFCFLSNLTASLSTWLVKGEVDIKASMNSPLGARVTMVTVSYCMEAGILISSDQTRILNMKRILFLSLSAIVFQVWELTETQLFSVFRSGECRQRLPYIRVAFYSVILLTVHTWITIYISSKIELDCWLLFNLSGNISLIVRAVFVAVEIALVVIAWHVENGLDKLEDAIYYVQVGNTALTVLCRMLHDYYKWHAPLIQGHVFMVLWVINVVCYNCIWTYPVCKQEWDSFRQRRLYLQRINRIPAASSDDISEYDDVCSVCYASITDGKKLPCGHLFHPNCLRKWFLIRTSCPLCKAEIVI